MKKILWILGFVILGLIVIVTVVSLLFLGPIVKVGMEQIGPKVTQVSIKVDAVEVWLLTGSASIKGLVVGNPAGYTTPEAMRVGTVSLSVDPFSVTSNKILVHAVHVESPEITFEGGLSRNNLTKILDNVNDFSRKGSYSVQMNNKPAPKIEVDDFLITGAKVHINLSKVLSKVVSLPDIHLTDLGRDSNGLTPAELSGAVLKAICSDTISVVTSTVKDLGQGVKSLGQGAVKTVGDNISKITGSLSSFLGK